MLRILVVRVSRALLLPGELGLVQIFDDTETTYEVNEAATLALIITQFAFVYWVWRMWW